MSETVNDPKFFENLQGELLQQFILEAERLSERIGLILRREVREALKTAKPYSKIATSELYKSIDYEVKKMTYGYMIRCFAGVNYAVFVHEGTRPHFPPIEPIAQWVKERGIGQSFSIKSRKMVGNNFKPLRVRQQRSMAFKSYAGKKVQSEGKYSSQVRAIAYMIARKIARKGTKGYKFFLIGLDQAIYHIDDEIKGVTARLV